MPKPSFLYKIVPACTFPPGPFIPASLISPLEIQLGFIYLTTATQVPNTLDEFFHDHPWVLIVRIPYSQVESNIKWDDPTAEAAGRYGVSGAYAHLHNGLHLGAEELESAMTVLRTSCGWEEDVKHMKDWLLF